MIDPVEDHLAVLRRCFDFDAIRALLARPDFHFVMDGMAGAVGPSARRVLVDEARSDDVCRVRIR